MNKNRFFVIAGFIIIAALSRILPHPPNFAPIVGMSLFGAAYLGNRKWALALPLIAMFVSDLVINNTVYASYYSSFQWFNVDLIWVYLPILAIVGLGFILFKKVSTTRVIGGSLVASVLFFIASNFGVWISSGLYPITMEGLVTCYTAALPFFQNALLGDLFYAGVLFGLFELVSKRLPALQLSTAE